MTAVPETNTEILRLERWISESFEGGQIRRRELRLTEAEAGYVALAYPASLRPLGNQWYEITFMGARDNGR